MSWRSSFERVAVALLGGDDLHAARRRAAARQVADAPVVVGAAVALLRAVDDADGQRGAGEAGADVGGEVGAGGAVGQLAGGAVGKRGRASPGGC